MKKTNNEEGDRFDLLTFWEEDFDGTQIWHISEALAIETEEAFLIWSNCPWFLFGICISFVRKFFSRKLGKNSDQILENSEKYDKITVRGFYSFIGSSKK